MVGKKEYIPKKCVCNARTLNDNWNKPGFIVGILGHIIFGIASIVGIVLAVIGPERYTILIAVIWLSINAIDFLVSLLAHHHKGHSWGCSLRYARINIFYSGVLF
jgi:VIT1/CCC1 family predicted Fe2+/Mn2+ transporter